MDIAVEGGSAVSITPLLTEDDRYDHNAEKQVGRERGNNTAEVPSSSADIDNNMNTNDEEEHLIVVANYDIYTVTTTNEESSRELSLLLLRASLISFWNNYIKYYGYFSRWLFFVIIINIKAIFVVADQYSINYKYDDNYYGSWQYQLTACFLQFDFLATSIWFFTVAKLIDQQVINLDRMVQFEQAATTTTSGEDEISIDTDQQEQAINDNNIDIDTAEVGSTTTILLPRLLLYVPNYDNIYGRVSRKIDRFLQQQQQQLPTRTDEDVLLSSSTSCLINLSYVLWSLFLATSFYGITDLLHVNYLSSLMPNEFCDDYVEAHIPHRTMALSELSACLILIGTGCWLLIREGVPSGIIPLVFVIVAMLHQLVLEQFLDDPDLYFEQDEFAIILMTLGTILFHITLCCCCSFASSENHNISNNNRIHSSWITRNLLVWALYGWIVGCWAVNIFSDVFQYGDYYNHDIDFYDVRMSVTALVLLAFTGIILQHPIIQLMGICTIFASLIILCSEFDIISFLIISMVGIGLISAGNWITKNINTNTITTGCLYVYKLCRCLVLCRCFSH